MTVWLVWETYQDGERELEAIFKDEFTAREYVDGRHAIRGLTPGKIVTPIFTVEGREVQ